MITLKTERAAWLYLARKWDAPKVIRFTDRTHRAYVLLPNDETKRTCLCSCLASLFHNDAIDEDLYMAMWQRVKAEESKHPRSEGVYFLPRTVAGAKKRAALCRRFAKEIVQAPR